MRTRLLGGAALVLALGIGSAVLVQRDEVDPTAGSATASQSPESSPATPVDAGASAPSDGAAATSPSAGTTAVPAPGATTSAPSARTPQGVSEVIRASPFATSTLPGATGPESLGEEPAPKPVDLAELPTDATSTQGVLAGWPRSALPVVASSRVRSTSVAPGPGVVQLGLDAVSSVQPDAVLSRYREAMAEHGFTEQPSADPNAGSTVAFVRGTDSGTDSVTVTVAEVERGTSYAVFAVLHPAAG